MVEITQLQQETTVVQIDQMQQLTFVLAGTDRPNTAGNDHGSDRPGAAWEITVKLYSVLGPFDSELNRRTSSLACLVERMSGR